MGLTGPGDAPLKTAGSCLGCCRGGGRDASSEGSQIEPADGGGGGPGFVMAAVTMGLTWLDEGGCGGSVTNYVAYCR